MRRAAGVVGELLITIGVLLALFAVYQAWWTDLGSVRAQRAVDADLEQAWASSGNPRITGATAADPAPAPGGVAFARLHIPSFGADYRFAVVSGTDDAALEAGPGHYPHTQQPGEPGNFAVAGHRVGRGSPFNDLDALRTCDALVFATADSWSVYRVLPIDAPDPEAAREQASRCLSPELADRVTSGGYAGLSGMSVVSPEDVQVLYPVPGRPGPASPDMLPLATLTTCHPRYSAEQRLVVHAVLERSERRVPGSIPAELTG